MTTIRELGVKISYLYDQTKADKAERDIKDIKTGFKNIETGSTRAAVVANKNMDRMASSAKHTGSEIARIGDTLESWGNRLNALAAVAGVGFSVGSLIRMVDQWKVVAGQVKLVTANQKEAKETQNELYKIASRTRQEYASTAGLFTSIARNAGELGKSNNEVLAFTEDVANAMLIGGGDKSSQDAALVQLGQALGSGTLRGDELNSIMEQAPRLAKVIADGMGTTIGQLRQMGAEGKLTAKDVFNAIRSQSDRLKMEMGQIPWTVEQAMTRMSNAFGKLFYGIESRTGIVSSIAEGIAKIADYVENININALVDGFKLLVIYASAFLVVSKWEAIITVSQQLLGIIRSLRNAYLASTGAAVAFKAANAGAAVAGLLAMGKFLLIAGAVALVILAIDDFIGYLNGAESVTGRLVESFKKAFSHLGRLWEDLKNAIGGWLNEIGNTINQYLIEPLKTAAGWIEKVLVKLGLVKKERIEGLDPENPKDPYPQQNGFNDDDGEFSITEAGKATAAGGPGMVDLFAGIGSYLSGELHKMTSLGSDSASVSKPVTYNNNGTQNNNIYISAQTNATPEQIGNAVVERIPSPNDRSDNFDFDGYPQAEAGG